MLKTPKNSTVNNPNTSSRSTRREIERSMWILTREQCETSDRLPWTLVFRTILIYQTMAVRIPQVVTMTLVTEDEPWQMTKWAPHCINQYLSLKKSKIARPRQSCFYVEILTDVCFNMEFTWNNLYLYDFNIRFSTCATAIFQIFSDAKENKIYFYYCKGPSKKYKK